MRTVQRRTYEVRVRPCDAARLSERLFSGRKPAGVEVLSASATGDEYFAVLRYTAVTTKPSKVVRAVLHADPTIRKSSVQVAQRGPTELLLDEDERKEVARCKTTS